MKRFVYGALALAAASVLAARPVASADILHAQARPGLPEVLKKTFAYYATLTSYSDTGTMLDDGGGTGQEARFTTYFRRASRDFYFDYQLLWARSGTYKFYDASTLADVNKNRTVIWMFKNQMEKYQQPQGIHEVVNPDNGGQVRGLGSTNHETRGASIMIPSLLYSQARLPSTLLQIEEAELVGTEEINKRRCHKITGVAAAYYPSGQRTSVRQVTIWIDVETQLIRRVFEDTPKGYGNGTGVARFTFTFEPQANPAIEDGKFQFKVPSRRGFQD
jgi:outer membrane lipoprotein-sorting protein